MNVPILANCILSFAGPSKGAQAFLDLYVPILDGEHACRVFFEGVCDTIHPLETVPGNWPGKGERKVRLVKVSMCANGEGIKDTDPALAWFNQCGGKLYWCADKSAPSDRRSDIG